MNARFAPLRSAIAATLLFGAGLVVAGPTYTLTNLGTFGGVEGWGAGINELGQATGSARDSAGRLRAFVSGSGPLRNLGTLGSGESYGLAINDAGQVAGISGELNVSERAFVYRDGTMFDLGTLGGAQSGARGINNAGQVAGIADTPYGTSHAFVYSDGVIRDLGTLGGEYSFGSAINASGQVTGAAQVFDGDYHAFWSEGSTLTDLGTLGGRYSQGYGINDAGEVVGISGVHSPYDIGHAFLYHDGHMDDLGTLYDGFGSAATDVNNEGQVVGWSGVSSGSVAGFIYSDGVMTDLNDLLPLEQRSAWRIMFAHGINDSGQIIATAWGSEGLRAVLLTPTIPEPSTAALLAAGLGLVAWTRRRHAGRRP